METWIVETWLNHLIPLGWCLFCSLWQSLIVISAYKIGLWFYPQISSRIRYVLGLTSLSLIFILFIYSILLSFKAPFQSFKPKVSSLMNLRSELNKNAFVHVSGPNGPLIKNKLPLINPFTVWVNFGFSIMGLFYICIVTLMMIHLFRNLRGVQELRNPDHLSLPSSEIQKLFEDIQLRMCFPFMVKLRVSMQINSPIAFGWIKPIILFPLGICSKLSIAQLEGLLIHELAHIRRNDYLLNFFQNLTETFLFFNPLVWFLNREIRNEREKGCDDLVATYYSGKTYDYARILLTLEEEKFASRFALSAFGQKNSLFARIQRIVNKPQESSSFAPLITGLLTIFMGLGLIGIFTSSKIVRSPENPLKQSSYPTLRIGKMDTNRGPLIPGEKDSSTHMGLNTKRQSEMDKINRSLQKKEFELDSISLLLETKKKERDSLVSILDKKEASLVKTKEKPFRYKKKIPQEVFSGDKYLDRGLTADLSVLDKQNWELDSLGFLMDKKGEHIDSILILMGRKKPLPPFSPIPPITPFSPPAPFAPLKMSKKYKKYVNTRNVGLHGLTSVDLENLQNAQLFLNSSEWKKRLAKDLQKVKNEQKTVLTSAVKRQLAEAIKQLEETKKRMNSSDWKKQMAEAVQNSIDEFNQDNNKKNSGSRK